MSAQTPIGSRVTISRWLAPRDLEELAAAVLAQRLAAGGRLIYAGAGTSIRIAVQDALKLDPVQLRRGLANGLTEAELTEAVSHQAFYAGWGKTASALDAVAAA